MNYNKVINYLKERGIFIKEDYPNIKISLELDRLITKRVNKSFIPCYELKYNDWFIPIKSVSISFIDKYLVFRADDIVMLNELYAHAPLEVKKSQRIKLS